MSRANTSIDDNSNVIPKMKMKEISNTIGRYRRATGLMPCPVTTMIIKNIPRSIKKLTIFDNTVDNGNTILGKYIFFTISELAIKVPDPSDNDSENHIHIDIPATR